MPRPARTLGPALALLALWAGGCDVLDNDDPICTAVLIHGISVTVEDSVSGAPSASGAQLVAQDGAYADTASIPANRPDLDAQPLLAAPERAGNYTVTLRKAGFVDWVRNVVVVRADECHVRTTEVTARLQPAP